MITLLTDFGVEDEYVGVLKGVILGIHPDARIVDVTHGIAPQDILDAAYTLKHAYAYFPKGSIHVAVIDPGVGSPRKILALRKSGHLFLAPDNGLLIPLIERTHSCDIRSVENEQLFLKPVSAIFHGRDVFAPVAAHLSKGYPFSKLGPCVHADQLLPLSHIAPRIISPGVLTGSIVAVDRFGNLVTNIDAGHLSRIETNCNYNGLSIRIGTHRVDTFVHYYDETQTQDPIALFGSRNCLEIAINLGNAANLLGARVGDRVTVCVKEKRT